MYSVFAFILMVLVLFFAVGFAMSAGSRGLNQISANAASSMALLVLFTAVVISCTSVAELTHLIDAISNGMMAQMKLLEMLNDYGSFANALAQSPAGMAEAFFDIVILSTLINLICELPLVTGDFRNFFSRMFVGMVVGLVALYLLNTYVKQMRIYQAIVSLTGAVISAVSVGSLPLLVGEISGRRKTAGFLFLIFIVFRSAFFKAIAFMFGIWFLEHRFGSVASAANTLLQAVIYFVPVLVVLGGIGCMLYGIFRRK